MNKRTTVYLDAKLHQAIRIKAVQMNVSLSNLINEAIRFSLREDAIDFKAIKEREQEPYRSFEDVLKDLRKDGII